MVEKPGFDVQAAHKYFSAECFNRAWDFIDKPERTEEEDERMLLLALASLWHWTEREDCTATNLSVGYWQVARTYALIGKADHARHYGQLSLDASQADGVLTFYRGYAYEALARAEWVAGDGHKKDAFILQARQVAQEILDKEDRERLLADLDTIH